MSKEIKKAMTAGYENATPAPTEVKEVNPAEQTVVKPAEEAAAPTETAPAAEAPKKEVKFAAGLFNEFKLGSTLKQGPVGNVLDAAKRK